MEIHKLARQSEAFYRPYFIFPNARTAFRVFLETLCLASDKGVLLPSFVGWSPREGSGVFDPIKALGLDYAFYQVDKQLHIDLNHLEVCLKTGRVGVLVLIHYFGFVDPHYQDAVNLARKHEVQVLEDEAHALYTDLVGGITGRLGDACIFSLHKLLPIPTGGLLVLNSTRQDLVGRITSSTQDIPVPWNYDLQAIAARRRENALWVAQLLQSLKGVIDPLWDEMGSGEVPQTFPVLVQHISRDDLYVKMNEMGFGVVSLYHTLIEPIRNNDFPASHWLARRILNLPVHQDVGFHALTNMMDALAGCVHSMLGVSP